MKKYRKPLWNIYYIKIEDTITNSSALYKPNSNSNDLQTEWEIGIDDVEENFKWD